MMGVKDTRSRNKSKLINLESLVPKNHLIRKIEKAIDLSFIREKVKHLYSNLGTESIDPVVLFKILIIQHTFGIRSMRQTIREIEVNLAYRWYLAYDLDEKIPHFSSFGKVYQRKFKDSNIFEEVFQKVIEEIMKYKLINEENVFVDGTHIKANANTRKYTSKLIEENSKFYQEELEKEIDLDRKLHKKKA